MIRTGLWGILGYTNIWRPKMVLVTIKARILSLSGLSGYGLAS